MKASCKQCGKQYQVDETKIKGTKARFKCRQCGSSVEVYKTAASSLQLEDLDDLLESMPSAEAQNTNEYNNRLETAESPPKFASIASDRKTAKTKGLSLVTKFIVIMLIVSLVPFCSVWSILYSQIRTQIKQNAEHFIDQVTTDLTINVNTWVGNNVSVLKSFSTLEGMASMDPAKQVPLLRVMAKQYPWMYLVFTADLKGVNVARSDDHPLETFSERQYFKDILDGKDPAWQVLIGKSSGKPTLVLAVPIVRDGLIVGILCNAMAINDISNTIANWKRGETGMAFMVDEKGMVIAHQDERLVLEQKFLSDHPLIREFKDGKNGTVYFDHNKEAYIGNVQATRYGWALAVEQSEKEAFATVRRTLNFLLIGLLATACVVAIIAWVLGRVLIKPIKELTEAAERISVGNLDADIEIHSKDEIAILGNAIARMQESIRLSLRRLKR